LIEFSHFFILYWWRKYVEVVGMKKRKAQNAEGTTASTSALRLAFYVM
jgi:hypothetical protein